MGTMQAKKRNNSSLAKENIVDHSEFVGKEHLADKLAEWTADFIIAKGYKAYAQSERNLIHGFYQKLRKPLHFHMKKLLSWQD